MKKKKYALNNSYFKNKYPNDPDTILEIAKYKEETGELPFDYHGDNWVYDAFCERQKRKGVMLQQFLTPDKTAESMAYTAMLYTDREEKILDACCGTGQLIKALIKEEFDVMGFDIDNEMVELCQMLYPDHEFYQQNYKEPENEYLFKTIVSNPPYDSTDLTEFLEWLYSSLDNNGIAVLLLPWGFLDKARPARLVKILNNYSILERRNMEEKFERTGCVAEIAVLQKL